MPAAEHATEKMRAQRLPEFYVDINKNTQVLDTAPLLFAVGIVIPSFFTLFLFGLSVYFYLATTCWW